MRTLSREQAIEDIRRALLELVDDEHSLCQVAGEKRIFCHGFKQWTDSELFKRFAWIAERRKVKTRSELEEIANHWHTQRQSVLGLQVACDAQQVDHDQCWGWDEFDGERLARFHRELCGEDIRVMS